MMVFHDFTGAVGFFGESLEMFGGLYKSRHREIQAFGGMCMYD